MTLMLEWMIYFGTWIAWWAEMRRYYDKEAYGPGLGIVLFILTPLAPLLFACDIFRAAAIYVEKNK
jgi:hypothetical protein